ncbi:MAG: putative Na+/H+ antiporter [Xanthobacteraceae bacterium]|nr:putative Na+/H+ antiporter [Xanthobacteraceae bacterium]
MQSMITVNWIELTGATLFGLAVLHTFSTRYFEHLAHTRSAHAGLWHLLGEVETVFGFWAFVLLIFMAAALGWGAASDYLDNRRFVEPMFVFVIMVISASRPILQLVSDLVRRLAIVVPLPVGTAYYFLARSLIPLLGSFVTEPAAMTLAALMLRDVIFSRQASNALKYGTLGVLFVNVSIGGTLTHFAAPPVLMVASKWGWDTAFVFSTFGWKAVIAVFINALVLTLLFRMELAKKAKAEAHGKEPRTPAVFVLVNLAILAGVVATNHNPEVFIGLFLLFLGLAEAYQRHHDGLMLREGLMVAFFLAGLVVLGGQQRWWLQAVLSSLNETTLFYGATALTAITDNAALTYLGSLVEGVSDEFKYALVAGAVAGGGLTVIANAPNPAGFAILKNSFDEQSINPLWLFLAALPPTMVAVLCFRKVPKAAMEMFDYQLWAQWFQSLDRTFLFLLILPFVVAVVALWSELARSGKDKRASRG